MFCICILVIIFCVHLMVCNSFRLISWTYLLIYCMFSLSLWRPLFFKSSVSVILLTTSHFTVILQCFFTLFEWVLSFKCFRLLSFFRLHYFWRKFERKPVYPFICFRLRFLLCLSKWSEIKIGRVLETIDDLSSCYLLNTFMFLLLFNVGMWICFSSGNLRQSTLLLFLLSS